MNLQTALSELVNFARENGGDERPRIRQACQRAEMRIDRLQMSRENRAAGRVCRRCGLGCFGLCCWKCWQEIPAGLRGCFDGAKTTGAKREATKAILDFIQRHPREARP